MTVVVKTQDYNVVIGKNVLKRKATKMEENLTDKSYKDSQ